MSRTVAGFDRLVVFVLGLVLVVGGAATGAWALNLLDDVGLPASSVPQQISTGPVTDAAGQPWWAYATAAGAVVLGLLGLWWLLAHIPHRGADALRLPGSSAAGALALDGDAAVAVAAQVIAEVPGVRSASGRMVSERGQLIAEMNVVADPEVDLVELDAAVVEVSRDLATVLSRSDVRGRVHVSIARSSKGLARVA
ncbi:hypothetical protein SAMN06264364_11748 [Quadrisphaera granulorum]|uniref:Uncharacterized protein n=1 Tax=Quadrisphaera granulorum TaxID=317664 RepID=A0A316A492_9ACTN|nr:hypothetical protein [Quadrisphaera granulorum]PWJ52796.1 hypothetical protein BXY45_11748 [Quadrisphaera granulorum]SZE97401.1 hypothetical protein SAMN06264364_11748 [Quadrisphaera granulorum]